MAFSIAPDLQTAWDNPERYGVVFITFMLGPNTYGLWSGQGDKLYGSVTYRAGATALELSDLQNAADGSVSEFTLKLSTAPDKGLTLDMMESFYDEDWQFGKVIIQIGLRDPVTLAIIGTIIVARGHIVEAPMTRSPKGGFIEVRVMSASMRLSESGGGYRNEASQKVLDPTDTGLVGIGSLGGATKKELKWGQTT